MARPRKQFTVNRASLSLFPESAISQLIPEIVRNAKNKKQALASLRRVKATFQAVINRVNHEPWKLPKKPQKRNAKSIEQRSKWFAALLEGKGKETYKATEELDERIAAREATQSAQPVAPAETQAEHEYRLNIEMCLQQDREREAMRRGVDVDDLEDE